MQFSTVHFGIGNFHLDFIQNKVKTSVIFKPTVWNRLPVEPKNIA